MPPRLKNLKTLIVDYTRVFGYKPHGNNKQFKELKGNRVLDTPRKKREFLDEMIDNKKQETAISKIKNIFRKSTIKKFQESFRKYTEKRKKYINDFKNKLKNNRIITLQRSEINLNSSIIQIIEIIQNQIDITKENVVIGVKNMSYTLTPENIKKLIDIAKEGGYLEEIVEGGSDNRLVYDVFTAPEIIIEKYYKSNKYKTKEGDFFTYYLKDNININLEDLQIYKKDCDDKKRNLDNCLLFSLKQYGIADEKLEKIKEMIKLKKIPISDIKIVCDKLRVGITIWFSNTNQTRKVSYGKQYDININIGYIENHYFLIKDTKYTSYSIKNYDSVKDLDDFNMIYKKTGMKSNQRFINTFELVSLMMENKDYFFDKIDAGNINKYDEIYLDKLKDNSFACLEYDINDYREVSFDKTKIEPDLEVDEKTKIVYFDFETGKIKRNGKIFVEPFLCCTIDNQDNKKSFLGKNCAYNMLNSLNQDTILIAHNAKFDYTFLTKHLWKCKEICNGSAFITFTGYFGKIKIQIKDSYKLIPMRLSEFPKAFKLDYVKEYMPYDLYTDDNINLRYIEYEAVLDYIENDNEKEIFDENIAKWDLVKDSCVDMIEYARKYCEIDVQLLRDSYNIFRDNCISHFNIDVNKILTIPTLADKYLISEGCYDGVYELSGQPRQFIQNCIVGGRTMCCNNEKNILENVRVNDFDAVSLYPSAMYRINGFLKGLPKVITNLDYNVVKNYDGYFVQIKIKKIGIDRKFGLCSYIDTDKGVRNFTNDLVGRIVYIDKTGLEDLINFQNVEFEIVKGYYFDEGFNTKINQVIKTIFDKRLQLKKEKNVGQLIYKLIMNSGYGKAIQKSHDVDTKLFDNRKDFESYLSKNYNKIKSFVKYDDDKKFKVSVGSTMTDHFNRCHIGVEILSMSKRIMNEVICLAEDNSLNIYYQDTDSIHIEDKDIAVLSALYKNKYDKDLIGNNLGQFHSDFELEGANKNIIATDSIFLGKKSYVDKLVGEDDAGNKINGFHFRMKGIPSKVVEYYCNENKITIFELYRKMYNGDMIDFDLTCGGTKFTIKHEKDYTINIIDDFRRKVCFA